MGYNGWPPPVPTPGPAQSRAGGRVAARPGLLAGGYLLRPDSAWFSLAKKAL
jgi:hypothetical protein